MTNRELKLDDLSLKELKDLAYYSKIEKRGLRSRQDYINKLSSLQKINDLLIEWDASLPRILGKRSVKEIIRTAEKYSIEVTEGMKKRDLIKVITEHPSADAIAESLQPQKSVEVIKEELEEVKEEIEETVRKVSIPPMDDPECDPLLRKSVSLEIDFDKCEDMLDQARMRFEEHNFEGALSSAVEARDAAEKCRRDFENAVMAYAILSAQHLIEECGKVGRDVEKAADLLRNAKRLYREGEFYGRTDLLENLEAVSKSLYSAEVQRSRDQIHTAQEQIRNVINLGGDPRQADEMLNSAREALRRNEYQECITRATRAIELAKQARLDRIKTIESEIPITVAVIEEAKHVGADIGESERLISKAKTAIASKDYLLASELVKRAERAAMESQQSQIVKAMALRRRQIEKAQGMITQVEPVIEEAQSFGINTTEVQTLLQQAKEVLAEGDYVNGTIFAKNASEAVKKLEPFLVEERTKRGITKPSEGVCASCGSRNLEFTDDGWSCCQDCGYIFRWRAPGGVWWRFKSLWKG